MEMNIFSITSNSYISIVLSSVFSTLQFFIHFPGIEMKTTEIKQGRGMCILDN